jgi:iron complex transport system substrate-binding protein
MTRAILCRWVLPAALAVALLAAPALAGTGVQALDATGVTVTLAAPAQRIVSLAPHATELLYAADAGERIVGVIETSDWPPAARALPRVGDSRAIDLERILALKPDLVVTWPYTAPMQVARLRARGIPVFTSDPKTVEGIAADLERLGTLVGRSARAHELAAGMMRRVAEQRHASAGRRSVAVFYEIWPKPLYTIGGGHLISQALAVCGGSNVFGSLTLPAPVVGTEAVLAARPEVIIAAADDGLRPDWLDEWRRWPALPAVAAGNLFVVDGNLLHRPGPRFIDGVDELCRTLDTARRADVRQAAAKR